MSAPVQITRRRLTAGAAWTVPVVAAAAAAPAYAASATPPKSYGTICRIFYGDGTVNAQRMSVSLGLAHDGSGYQVGVPYTWVFTFDQAVAAPSVVTGSWFTMTAKLSADAKSLTVTVVFSTVPTTNPYCGSLAINWDPGTQVMPPKTTVNVSMATNSVQSGTLSWKVPQRYDVSNGSSDNTPHYYISRSGLQTCYPETRYSYFNKSGSTWTTCGVNGNDTSTIYPDGTCQRLTLTTGTQNSLAAVC